MNKISKIDAHAHAVLFQEYEFPAHVVVTPEQLLAVYDEMGVEKGVLLPITAPDAQTLVMSNGCVREIVRRYPERFDWFCNVDPRLGDNAPETDFSAYLEFYRDLGAKGMGELTANLYADSPLVDSLFSHCEACDMPVTIHIGPQKGSCYGIIDEVGLPRLEKMLKNHPKLKILGHSQPFWAEIDAGCCQENRNTYPTGPVKEGRLAYLLREYENLYCDMSAYSCCNALTRDADYGYRFIEEFGDRMLYGIDMCLPSDRQIKALAAFLDEGYEKGCISEKHYRGICRENAIRVLKL